MLTAIKASKKMSTAPPMGNTIGIMGTMSSMGSCSWSSGGWGGALDIQGLSKVGPQRRGTTRDFSGKLQALSALAPKVRLAQTSKNQTIP